MIIIKSGTGQKAKPLIVLNNTNPLAFAVSPYAEIQQTPTYSYGGTESNKLHANNFFLAHNLLFIIFAGLPPTTISGPTSL